MLPFKLASQCGCLVVLVMTPYQIPNLQPPPFCILIFYFVEYVHRHIGLIFFSLNFLCLHQTQDTIHSKNAFNS